MQGKGDIRFSELVQDTIREHGLVWAAAHYAAKGKRVRGYFTNRENGTVFCVMDSHKHLVGL